MFWILTIIFSIFLFIDVLGHFILKIKRKAFEWILMSVLIILTIGSIIVGAFNNSKKDKKDASELFVAYKYMLDGQIQRAQSILSTVGGGYGAEASVLEAMLSLLSQDYIQGYFKTERLLSSDNMSETDKKFVQEVQNICMEEMGISEIAAYETNDYGEYLAELEASSTAYSGSNVITDNTEAALELIRKYVDELDFTDKEVQNYTEAYEMDRILYGEDITHVTQEDIKDIKNKYGEDEDILRLECKYYVSQGDYEKAKETAERLVNKYRNEENYIIYTDIIAQQAYDKLHQSQYEDWEKVFKDKAKDKEVQKLIKEAGDKLQEAEKLQERFGEDSEEIRDQIDKLLSEAEELYTEANCVDIKRAINYIISKKPINGDNTGMYDLQLAKLYLITGDREKANEYLHKVIDNSVNISKDSVIKEAVDEVVSEYNKISDDEYNAELNAAIDTLIKEQSNSVVPSNEGTVNGSFDSYVTNTLKYDKINIHISRIDTSDYPTLRAYVNINGNKDGKAELASDFTENDFDLIDTLYQIEDFKIIKEEGYNQVSIAVVMDKSGSMSGTPLENAKAAAVEAVNYMNDDNERIAVITYDGSADVEQELTESKERLKRSINGISAGGDTNIAGGLRLGIDTIKDEVGSRAVILMSDGEDGYANLMPDAIEYAVKEGISVYTVSFGAADEVYMKSIADATGGKYIRASDSSELSDIYLTLQRYIVNNYCIEYKVEKNVDTDPRNLTVNISKYNTSDNMDYYINEENKPEEDDSKDFIERIDENTLGISSITPNTISVQMIESGLDVTITGGGFEEGMDISVGSIPLTNVSIISKTELKGTLKGKMDMGKYDIQIKTSDGKLAVGNKMFYVFKAGSTQSVRLGCATITADKIGQTGESTLIASGNVMINGFIHSSGDMEITVDNMNKDIDLTASSSVYVGENGNLVGDSKLYISYARMEEANGETFANLVMGGQDYILQRKRYAMEVNNSSTSFDADICDFDLAIPFIMDIDIADVNLYSNRLQIDVKSFRIDEIIENVDNSLKHKTGNNKPEPKPISRGTANSFNIKDFGDIGLSVALTPDGIQFGGEVKINVNDAISFGTFGINEIGIKLNSLDADNEYWKISGKMDFSKIIKGFGDTGVEGIDGAIASYYWLPDSLELNASLNPGIPIYKIIEINEVGGSMQGISTLILSAYEKLVSPQTYTILGTNIQSDAYNAQDIILKAKLGAEANIFNAVDIRGNLFKKFKEWGEIGDIDGTIEVNFSEPEFKIGAEMSLLGSEKANAEATINKNGLDVAAGIDLNISGFSMDIAAGADANVGGNLEGAYIKLGLNGKVDCPPLKIHTNGEVGAKLEFQWDFQKASITLNYKDGGADKEGTLWYDEDGGLFLWDKISVTTN